MIRLHGFALALTIGAVAAPLAAQAQSPTMGGQPPGGTVGEEEPKKEGVAEKAPKEANQLPTLPPLPPYPGQEQKKFELITLNGYFRMRAAWLDNFHLGFHDFGHGSPFPEPATCSQNTPDSTQTPIRSSACNGSIGTSNIRARLEPTIHLSETVALHMQADVLDNLVLGSTADGVFLDGSMQPNIPSGSLSNRQVAPEQGLNSPWSSIRVKQAWGEVRTPLGDLQFGRMPSQWGMGMLTNSGGYDWIHGTTCTDCDYGDNVDRFIFGTTIPGTSFRAAVGVDWLTTGPSSGQLDLWKGRADGQPYDLEDKDDAFEYVLMITHIDDPKTWNAALREGATLFNYGVHFQYRTQEFETTATLGQADAEKNYKARHATVVIPDVWGRLTSDKVTLEAEAAGVFGSVDNLVDPAQDKMSLRELGAVARLTWLLVNDNLELGLEAGFASGDQWEDPKSGIINIHYANYLPQVATDTSITSFHFNYDYHVDMILFRELLGAVTNATYFKPWIRYNITDRFWFKAAAIGSAANVPVATPGNGTFYGIELNGDLGYNNEKEGFFAGFSYGVLFPLGAMDHPHDIFTDESTLGAGEGAGTAQTIQGRFVLKF